MLQEFKEVSKLSKDDTGIELRPDENNIYAWKGFLQVKLSSKFTRFYFGQQICSKAMLMLQGPKDTPFDGGVFEVTLQVPEQYPLIAPNVRFKTKIFHPNVHFKVCICCTKYQAVCTTA